MSGKRYPEEFKIEAVKQVTGKARKRNARLSTRPVNPTRESQKNRRVGCCGSLNLSDSLPVMNMICKYWPDDSFFESPRDGLESSTNPRQVTFVAIDCIIPTGSIWLRQINTSSSTLCFSHN